ncbi:MAG: membrane dipeptidase, partial [Gammaproteobacteria bacterium]|nr:membrane dipeptidase [Gammaproteobacteria bacterium]
MLKKLLIGLLTLLIITYAAARSLLPEKLDRQHNPVVFAAPYKVSNEVNQFYQSIDFIADLHGDTLLWKRDILKEHDYGHLDLPRLQQANVAMQFFTIVNKVPENLNFDKNDDTTDQLTIPFLLQGRSASDLSERVLEQAAELHQYSKDSNGQLVVVTNKKELQSFISQRKNNKQLTSGLLGIEGGQALKGDIKILDKFYDAGIRMIGLTHFFDNEIGGSAHGVNKGGITEFGKQVVKAMEAKNMLVDLSHASPKLIDDV